MNTHIEISTVFIIRCSPELNVAMGFNSNGPLDEVATALKQALQEKVIHELAGLGSQVEPKDLCLCWLNDDCTNRVALFNGMFYSFLILA